MANYRNVMTKESSDAIKVKHLIKVDKNGTEYYEGSVNCEKCGGVGRLACYKYWDGGICYACEGQGKVYSRWIVRKPEYQAKLDENTKKRNIKEAEDGNAKVKEIFPQMKMWLVLGNTFKIKDQIKADGGRFNEVHGWYFTEKKAGYQLQEVDVKDAFLVNIYGKIQLRYPERIKKNDFIEASEYVGEIGQKLETMVTFEGLRSINIEAGRWYGKDTLHIIRFKDENGNIIIWKTSTLSQVQNPEDKSGNTYEEGTKFRLTATVKDHSEYRSNKQTIITRAKLELIK